MPRSKPTRKSSGPKAPDVRQQPREVLDMQGLQCSVCLNPFSTDQETTPMLLPCAHTFCGSCIQGFSNQECPVCRAPFSADGVKKNFHAVELLLSVRLLQGQADSADSASLGPVTAAMDQMRNVEKAGAPTSEPCHICRLVCEEAVEATLVCLDCAGVVRLCQEHGKCHAEKTREHRVVSRGAAEAADKECPMLCTQHEGQRLEAYCRECDEMLCPSCAVVNHSSHSVLSVEIRVEELRKEIPEQLQGVEGKLHQMRERLEQVVAEGAAMDGSFDAGLRAVDAVVDEVRQWQTEMCAMLETERAAAHKTLRMTREEVMEGIGRLTTACQTLQSVLAVKNVVDVVAMHATVKQQLHAAGKVGVIELPAAVRVWPEEDEATTRRKAKEALAIVSRQVGKNVSSTMQLPEALMSDPRLMSATAVCQTQAGELVVVYANTDATIIGPSGDATTVRFSAMGAVSTTWGRFVLWNATEIRLYDERGEMTAQCPWNPAQSTCHHGYGSSMSGVVQLNDVGVLAVCTVSSCGQGCTTIRFLDSTNLKPTSDAPCTFTTRASHFPILGPLSRSRFAVRHPYDPYRQQRTDSTICVRNMQDEDSRWQCPDLIAATTILSRDFVVAGTRSNVRVYSDSGVLLNELPYSGGQHGLLLLPMSSQQVLLRPHVHQPFRIVDFSAHNEEEADE